MSSKNGVNRRWSLAARLTTYYAASAFLIVAVATGFLYWAMVRNLDLKDDRALEDKVRLLRSILESAPRDESALQQEVNESWQAGQTTVVFMRIFDEHGATLSESPGMKEMLPKEVFPNPVRESARGVNYDAAAAHSFRLMSARCDDGLIVQVALDRTAERELLSSYEESLWYALAMALVVSALAGYLIARRGLRPILDISQTAALVRPGNLGERMSLTGMPAELVTLASTFNQMLDRLENAFERLKAFSADIAHELRTPLNNLRGELDVVLQKQRTPAEYADAFGSCLEECARLERIIDSLLFLARAENPQVQIELEECDLAEELRRVGEFFDPMAQESGVRIETSSAGAVFGRVSRPLFQRAAGNLVSNAVAHTPAGGTITLAVREAFEQIVIEVVDTGEGITAADLPNVFNRFFRADRSRTVTSGGAGLGLAIVKSIVELHHGTIDIASQVGQGTQVSIRIPRVDSR